MKKRTALVLFLFMLLGFSLAACGSAVADQTAPGEPAPEMTAEPVPEPSAEPAPAITKAELVAELNSEIADDEEKATQEAIEQYKQENEEAETAGETETTGDADEEKEIEVVKNVEMRYMLLADDRIALNISESFLVPLIGQMNALEEESDRQTLLEIYDRYIDMLRGFQGEAEQHARERVPDAEVLICLYADNEMSVPVAQIEKGEVVFDVVNGIDAIHPAESAENTAPAPEAAPVPTIDPMADGPSDPAAVLG